MADVVCTPDISVPEGAGRRPLLCLCHFSAVNARRVSPTTPIRVAIPTITRRSTLLSWVAVSWVAVEGVGGLLQRLPTATDNRLHSGIAGG